MAQLDVSHVLSSPMLSSRFIVNRREQVMNPQGRSEVVTRVFPDVPGVVTLANPNDLERLDDSQRMGRNYSIITKFRLIGPAKSGSKQYQPDTIVWQGSELVVKNVEPYTNYGAGFVQALAGSMDIVDEVT